MLRSEAVDHACLDCCSKVAVKQKQKTPSRRTLPPCRCQNQFLTLFNALMQMGHLDIIEKILQRCCFKA